MALEHHFEHNILGKYAYKLTYKHVWGYNFAMEWIVSPPNSYVEALTPDVI